MSSASQHHADPTKIYALVSFGHKEQEGQKNENFFVFTYAGIVDAAALLDPDIKIEWHGPNAWDPIPEIEAIRALTTRNVGGIIVTAADKKALNPAINAAIQAGIPVITFDADAPESDRLTFVGTNNYQAGYLAGATMAQWLNGQGDIAIASMEHADHLEERVTGFKAAIQQHAPHTNIYLMYDRADILIGENGRRDYNSSRQNYRKMLQTYPGIRGLFATFAAQGDGAALAVEDEHLRGKVQILAFDFDEDTTRLIVNDDIQGTVGQESYLMGYISMILAYAARQATTLPTKQDGVWRINALTAFLDAHPEMNKHTAAKLRRIIATLKETPSGPPSPIDTGVEILGKDGLLRVLAQTVEDMRDSISEKIVALSAEVEERKQAQEALQHFNEELEQRVKERTAEVVRQKYILDTFMENVPDAIYFKDLDCRITHANKAHALHFGLDDPAKEIGRSDFDFFPEELARQKCEQEQQIIRTGQPILALEEPDASGIWALTSKFPLRDEQGAIIGTFGISRNITELKQAQEALKQAYSEISTLNDQLKEENLRMSAELNVSRRLQQMMLPVPEELKQIEGLDIVGFMQPADEVGGDYYDVLQANGAVHIGIGDVTGHGLESGVLMLMTQTAIRTLIDHGETDPIVFFTTLNRILYHNIQRMNVDKTLTLAVVNYQDGLLKIVGQHEELIVVRKDGQVERVDTINLGFPIGLEEDIARFVAEKIISLFPGDGIVLYTDGITEAENVRGEMYGIERLCDALSRHWPNTSAENIKRIVIDDVTRHIGGQKVYDDLTLVVLKQQ